MTQFSLPTPPRYSLGFLAASLRPELARIVAEIYLQEGTWAGTKTRVISSNALQCRTAGTTERMEQELRLRLMTLTAEQIALLATAAGPDRAALTWLAAIKRYLFLFEFAADVLRDKLVSLDHVFRYSDYETYVETRSATHTEIARLRESSRNKVRQTLMNMLVEAGLLVARGMTVVVQRPPLALAVRDAIAVDDPKWLAGFLFTDAEIGALRCR
jgi:hypothetical protein